MKRISVSELDFPVDTHRKPPSHNTERWRGPHEFRTVGLMINGIKPAALCDESGPDFKELDALASAQRLKKIQIRKLSTNDREYVGVVFTQLDQEWRAHKLAKIYKQVDETNEMRIIDHARVGILLGYSNKEIRYFLNDQ